MLDVCLLLRHRHWLLWLTIIIFVRQIRLYHINYDVDWSGIVSEIIAGRTGYTTTSTNALMVASFIRAIGEYVQANYSSDGTGAPSANVVSLFSTLGLKNARLTNGFVKNDAFDMIVEKQLPMYLEAWGGKC